jgi:hypothetical protein
VAWIDPSLLHTRRERRTPDLAIRRNTYDITLKGSRLMLTLNGVKTVDVENSQRASGPFALQWGRGVIKFRKVQIRSL